MFAKKFNGRVWQLLETPSRSQAEDDEMLHAAHASLYHWLQVGAESHHQRGEWMIARVHLTLGNAAEALRHARRCMELTEKNRAQMQDFDIAYANEGMARASALVGDHPAARHFHFIATAAGKAIADKENRDIFMADLNSGEWYGALTD
jgi:hypothetical protein